MASTKRMREPAAEARKEKSAKGAVKFLAKAGKALEPRPAVSPLPSALKGSKRPTKAVDDAAVRPAKKARVHASAPGGKPEVKPAATVAATAAATAAAAAIALANAPSITIQIVAGSYDRTLHGVTATVRRAAAGAATATSLQFADTFLFNAHASAIRCLALSPPSAPVPGQGQKVMLATGSTDERINIYNLSAHPAADDDDADGAGEAEDDDKKEEGGGDGGAQPGRLGIKAATADERALLAAVVRRPVMAIAENARNRELGTLLHHTATVTRLAFPTRSKLLSASEDSTIGVTRTRDWSLLSMIRAPVPRAGTNSGGGGGGSSVPRRPSGDTAPPGGAPSGINDFAVHPSLKVMLSVSRGERCMRLWNLVTGKKAGVLNFTRDLLQRDLGESKFATGDARQVTWGRSFSSKPLVVTGSAESVATEAAEATTASAGSEACDEFAIGFDRNVVVFGMDSVPRCRVLADARTKTHDFHYLEVDVPRDSPADKLAKFSLLAVATEDGRVLLCSTHPDDLVAVPPPAHNGTLPAPKLNSKYATPDSPPLPRARLIGQIGGPAAGVTGRIKALKALCTREKSTTTQGGVNTLQQVWYVVTASSTGALRVWKLTAAELWLAKQRSSGSSGSAGGDASKGSAESEAGETRQLGRLLGLYQTPSRITCLEAFVMIPRPEDLQDSEDEQLGQESDGEEDEDEDE